ncbi:MAG: Na+:solute symporter [Phycisphaerales bacterium]|nr:MAG: Na+:solute symporter [Phycisphaerales bacterium]
MEIPQPSLHFLDYLIVCLYLIFALGVGFVLSKKASKGAEAYFLGGRSLPWWAIGISMVATSFASDTPLFVTEVVREHGLQRLWWILAWVIMLIVGIFLFARLWRRAKIITDAEFYELRYAGKPATFLRGFRAFFSGIVQNLLTMAWVTFAMSSIMATMTGIDSKLAVGLCVLVAMIYALMSGFYGVVVTDVVQFFLATASMGILAFLAILHVGGLESMLDTIVTNPAYGKDTLRIFPDFTTFDRDVMTLLVFVGIMWWSDVNGYNMQRISACRNERDSVKATISYAIFQTARPWLWAVVALVSIALYPTLPEGYTNTQAYPLVMNTVLGPGLKGLLVTAFLAAFMSTIDTHLNWGASYIMTDFYCRFVNKKPGPRRYMFVTRIVVVSLMALTACLVPMIESVQGAWEFFSILTIGYGIISFARWFWWRINAFTEIAALALGLIAACGHGVLITWFPESLVIGGVPWSQLDFPLKIALLTFIVVPICILTTFLTPPTPTDKLEAFYRRVRPGGFWGGVSKQARALPGKALSIRTWFDVAGGLGLCFGISLGIGYFLLTRYWAMVICLIIACIGAARVARWFHREVRELSEACDKEL